MKLRIKLVGFLILISATVSSFAVPPSSPEPRDQYVTVGVICPLSVEIYPTTAFDGYVYLRPTSGEAKYPVSTLSPAIYTVKGSTSAYVGHGFYFKITDNSGSGEPIVIIDNNGHSEITKGGVKLTMQWSMGPSTTVTDLHTPVIGISETSAINEYQLSLNETNKCGGIYYIFCKYESVTVTSNADLGEHVFSNTITASYNTF